MIAVNSA